MPNFRILSGDEMGNEYPDHGRRSAGAGRRTGDCVGQPGHGHSGFLGRLVFRPFAGRILGVGQSVRPQTELCLVCPYTVDCLLVEKSGAASGHLPELEQRGIHCYIQFTLNDYECEGLEPGVPPLTQRIDTFRRLVDRLGFGRVIWRFDPLVLTRRTGVAELLERAAAIGDRLKGYTERMVFSFVDLAAYRGVALRMARTGLGCREFTPEEMTLWAEGLSALNGRWNFELATCAEEVDLRRFGIEHNRCVDDRLMIRYFSEDRELMRFLGWPERYRTDTFLPLATSPNRDRGQRRACGCVWSKDIGAYGTCPHGCLYCYAARRTGMGSGALRAGTSWPESLQELAGGFTGVVPENR